MLDASHRLKEKLKERIEASADRRIAFSEFMALSLFDSECGYYTTREGKIGSKSSSSDFGTYPEKAPAVFGAGLARQYHEMWIALGRPAVLQLIEMGAGRGTMALSTLARIRQKFPDLYQAVRYVIVEISTELRSLQRKTLEEFTHEGKMDWIEGSGIDLPDPAGLLEKDSPRIFVSNELPDAFPVDRLRWSATDRSYAMAYVTITPAGKLAEVFGPLPDAEPYSSYIDAVQKLNARHQEVLEGGWEVPVNVGALLWMRRLSERLQRGYVLTIDYGYRHGSFSHDAKAVRVYAVAKPMFFYGLKITNRRLLAVLKEWRWDVGRRISQLRPYSWQRRLAVRLNVFRRLRDDVDYMYARPGEVDITSDIDFDLLAQEGMKSGLRLEGIMTQPDFFERLGMSGKALRLVDNPAFLVMIQSKGVEAELFRTDVWKQFTS
ncbi:MAG TPA: SAM-dependent methyltransferase [Thermoanaerobaculia bacterium]